MSSPKVTYSYANGSANTIRPTSVTYPDGKVLSYDYGTSGGQNDKLSRINTLGFDGTGNLVQPSYLGVGTPVRTSYNEPDVRWDLATGSSPNPYAGLDRFGRVIDNKWTNYSSSATLDQIKYGYDRASNRVWRENVVAKAQTTPKYFDELYGYDGSNRLSLMERGQLAGSPPSSITNKQFAQDWGLDPTGNWKIFKEDDNGDGTWDLNQTRTSNPVNEITAINETAGPSWVTPGYDSAGNMTTLPRPAEPTGDFTGIYDAWNRLIELQGLGATVVGRYAYDGLTRRVVKQTFPGWEELEAADWTAMTLEDWNGFQLTQAHRRDYYYNSSWQILEERVENDTTFDRQYVWGLQYIDGLVFRDRQLTSGVERSYALQDANWNVTALTDDNGAVVERYSYAAYGVPAFLNPDFTTAANNEAYDWDVLYAGYKWDPESELYQVRYRYLQPALGTWGSRDPIGYESEDVNTYRYTLSNPITQFDSTGKQACNNGICYCGPDITNWLKEEIQVLQNWSDQLQINISKWAKAGASSLVSEKELRKIYKYNIMLFTGPSLLYFPNTNFSTLQCPSAPTCNNTVTLAGQCIHTSEVGNFVLGAFARIMGMTWIQTTLGAIYGNRGKRTDADAEAKDLGWDYIEVKYSKTGMGMLLRSFLTGHSSRLKTMGSDAPANCAPCNSAVDPTISHIVLPPASSMINVIRTPAVVPTNVN